MIHRINPREIRAKFSWLPETAYCPETKDYFRSAPHRGPVVIMRHPSRSWNMFLKSVMPGKSIIKNVYGNAGLPAALDLKTRRAYSMHQKPLVRNCGGLIARAMNEKGISDKELALKIATANPGIKDNLGDKMSVDTLEKNIRVLKNSDSLISDELVVALEKQLGISIRVKGQPVTELRHVRTLSPEQFAKILAELRQRLTFEGLSEDEIREILG